MFEQAVQSEALDEEDCLGTNPMAALTISEELMSVVLCAQEQDSRGPSPLEALPEELVLHIFQYLGPEDLLIRAPMVCKRWHRLSRDTSIWRNQELAYRMLKEDEFILCLRKSPELLKLDCSGLAPLCPAERHLSCITCPVSKLVLGDDMAADVAVQLVERCLPHLDTLVVGRISMKTKDCLDLLRAIDHSQLRVLVFSPRCRQLTIEDYDFVACSPDKRTLRHLELWSEDDMPVLSAVKLIRAHSESLRVLSHEYMRRRPVETQEQRIMEAVGTCRRIEELRVWSSHRLRQLDGFESLRCLTLMCDGDCRLEESDGSTREENQVGGRACERFFTESAVLPRLRELCLRCHECSSGTCHVMKEIAERCPGLEVLAIRCSATDKDFNTYLGEMTRLHTLTLIGVHYIHPNMLNEWDETTVPALRQLVLIGTLRFCPWVCWAGSVKSLRQRRPLLRVKLRECEHFQ